MAPRHPFRTFTSLLNSTKVSEERRQAILSGAPFNASGFSQAKVYYTVQDLNAGTWLFNYNLYYRCAQGCACCGSLQVDLRRSVAVLLSIGSKMQCC
jgi:hypothetical protein